LLKSVAVKACLIENFRHGKSKWLDECIKLVLVIGNHFITALHTPHRNVMDSVTFQPIGYINSCYQEKFGVPRQPNLVLAAKAQLPLMEAYNEESVRGLEALLKYYLLTLGLVINKAIETKKEYTE